MQNLTVVLLSCGEETEEICLKKLKNTHLKTIKFVYPQIKALNQMIDAVDTEFFIEMNADIVLYDNWLERIQDKINSWDNSYYQVLFALWDTLTQERILALKLFKSSIMHENRFRDVPTPDVEHYQRLNKLGYKANSGPYREELPIGQHLVQGAKFCYSKYKDVYKTLKTFGYEWDKGVFKGGHDLISRSKAHFNFFKERYNLTGNLDYLWCIKGMLDGLKSLDCESKTLNFELPELGNPISDFKPKLF